jgi:thiamine biosynthesis lipoprotein ApbE
VSVFARSGTCADALSTALLVMGHERARAFAATHRELGVLWLEPRGARVVAEAWNLEVAAVAPHVTLIPSSSTSIARNPSQP